MTVKELLDKQHYWTQILISEEHNFGKNIYDCNTNLYLEDDMNRNVVYDEYGDREIEYFYHSIHPNGNKIVMCIKIIENDLTI